jgi:hypothetical protein
VRIQEGGSLAVRHTLLAMGVAAGGGRKVEEEEARWRVMGPAAVGGRSDSSHSDAC